jgi:hypothetical protein
MNCFHIRWSSSKLDWECHATKEAAEEAALRLRQPDEKFTIEEHNGHKGKVLDTSDRDNPKKNNNGP